MRILVLGATGGTGRLIVRTALSQGHAVTALVRSKSRAGDLGAGARGPDDVRLIEGDATSSGSAVAALEGCEGVISALGTAMSPFKEVTLLSDATSTLVQAMKQQSVRRLVCITGMGAGDSRGHGGFLYDTVLLPVLLRNVYADKDRQEAIIRESGLDWIIVRPTFLNDKPSTGLIQAVTDLTGINGGSIPRGDVASFAVAQLTADTWLRKSPLIRTAPA